MRGVELYYQHKIKRTLFIDFPNIMRSSCFDLLVLCRLNGYIMSKLIYGFIVTTCNDLPKKNYLSCFKEKFFI